MATARRCGVVLSIILLLGTLPQPAAAQFGGKWDPTGEEWLTHWWSWVFWWEANRENYLEPPDTAGRAPAGRGEAVASLTRALSEDGRSDIKAAAALALGRMEEASAVPRLIELTDDRDQAVRRAAWMALGLIGTPAARDKISAVLADPSLDEHDTLAWIVAIGLLKEPGDPLLKAMYALVNQDRSENVGRLAMWALRVHDAPGLSSLAREIIAETPDALLCNEAILALGLHPTQDDVETLIKIYHAGNSFTDAQALTNANHRYKPRPGAVVISPNNAPTISGLRAAPAIALARGAFDSERAHDTARHALARTYKKITVDGNERYYRRDASWVAESPEYGGFELRFGLIALGEIGDERDAELLVEVVRGQHTPFPSQSGSYLYPSRAFAALGLGLYLRQDTPGFPTTAKPDDDQRRTERRALRLLSTMAADRSQPEDLRAACLLALGLSEKGEAADGIARVMGTRGGSDNLLLTSHAVLALGMLNDDRALRLASRMLPASKTTVDADHIRKLAFGKEVTLPEALARRAVVLGLSLLGDPRGVKAIKAQFGQEPFTSMEIVRGLRWAGDDTLAETLVELLDDPETTPDVALVTAWSLGELFDPNDRPRLHAAILKDVNVTLPVLHGRDPERWMNHSAIYQYRCYTNEFLFKSMLIRPDGWRH